MTAEMNNCLSGINGERGLYRHKEPLEQIQNDFSEDMSVVWDDGILGAKHETRGYIK